MNIDGIALFLHGSDNIRKFGTIAANAGISYIFAVLYRRLELPVGNKLAFGMDNTCALYTTALYGGEIHQQ